MNDDDADFKPSQSTSSNLTSLFDTNRPRPTDNQSLTYTAPKPPKAGESSGTPFRGSNTKSLGTEKLEIIISKNIQLYKLENEKYVGQGAAGIAIIGHYDLHMYQIIIYKNNKEYLSKTYIQPNFTFTVLQNNYASFYDNGRQNWSILFPSALDVQHFAKQVAIAKYNSQSKQEKIVVQDLIPLGATKANKKDIVDLEFNCCILNIDDITPLKERSNWSVEIADNYTFPWQEGLKDCGYKCKRVVVIPYELSAPWMDEIQQNSSVVVEFEVESVRTPKHPGQNKTMPVEVKIQDESTNDSSADEYNCKVKPASLRDSIFLSRSHKADLISRIAKMGQALPLKMAFAYGPSDTPKEHFSQSRQANNQAVPSNCRPCSPQQNDIHHPDLLSTSPSRRCDIAWQQQQVRGDLNFAYQELYPMMSGPPGLPAQNYSRETETAGTEAELRFTINKVSEKVDHVLNKLQNFDATGWDKVKAHQTATILDPISVINSIQDVMAENESLKVEIQQQKSKINEQDSKLNSLMELTQRCVERCAYPGQKAVVTPAVDRIVDLGVRQTTDQLIAETNIRRIDKLNSEMERYKREISETQQQIKQFHAEIQDLVDKLEEKEKIIRNMGTELIETNAENEALISVNEQQKRDIQRLKQQKSTELQTALSEDLVEEIKKVMNAVNRKIQPYFDSDQFYCGKDIKAAIATTLKDVTVEYLKYRTKQKTASILDVGQREGPEMTATGRGISHLHLAAESNEDMSGTGSLSRRKSRIISDVGKVTSQKLLFADDRISQSPADARNGSTEEKSRSRLLKESSDRIKAQPSPTPDQNALGHDLKPIESLVRPKSDISSLHRNIGSADMSSGKTSRPSADTNRLSAAESRAFVHDMKSVETFKGESQRELVTCDGGEIESSQMTGASSRSSRLKSADEEYDVQPVKHSVGTTREPSMTSARKIPVISKTSFMESFQHRSTSTASRLSSGRDENIKGNSVITGELRSLAEDHEADSIVEKSAVTLSHILSDVTTDPTGPPSSYRSTATVIPETSSSWDMSTSNMTEESVMDSERSTLTDTCQHSENEENFKKIGISKIRHRSDSIDESFVFLPGERSDVSDVGQSKFIRESEIQTTTGRGTLLGINESMGRKSGDTTSGLVTCEEGFTAVGGQSTEPVSGMSSQKAIQVLETPPTSLASGVTVRELRSQIDTSFPETDGLKMGIRAVQEEERSLNMGNNQFEASTHTIGSKKHMRPESNMPSHTTENKIKDLRKIVSETDLGRKTESLLMTAEDGGVVNIETEKSSISLNKTISNVTKDISNQAQSEKSASIDSDYESSALVGLDERNSLLENEENSCTTGDAKSREEMDISEDKESEKDDGEKNSIDGKLGCSNSNENVNAGSNAVQDSPLFSDYYQGWESSKPPPLPLEEDDGSNETDEEWL